MTSGSMVNSESFMAGTPCCSLKVCSSMLSLTIFKRVKRYAELDIFFFLKSQRGIKLLRGNGPLF